MTLPILRKRQKIIRLPHALFRRLLSQPHVPAVNEGRRKEFQLHRRHIRPQTRSRTLGEDDETVFHLSRAAVGGDPALREKIVGRGVYFGVLLDVAGLERHESLAEDGGLAKGCKRGFRGCGWYVPQLVI